MFWGWAAGAWLVSTYGWIACCEPGQLSRIEVLDAHTYCQSHLVSIREASAGKAYELRTRFGDLFREQGVLGIEGV